MRPFSAILLVATGLVLLWSVFIDDDAFVFLVFIIVAWIFYKLVSANKSDLLPNRNQDQDTQLKAVDRFEKLVALLERKGVITSEEVRQEGLITDVAESHTPQLSTKEELSQVTFDDAPTPSSAHQDQQTQPLQHFEPEAPHITETVEREQESAEFQFSGNIMVWVGVVALLLGVGFFLKYSIDQGWFPPVARVMLGIVSGFVFMGLGEYFHNTYERYSNMLSGTGIALLYVSLYGTLYFTLLNPIVVLIFMGLVTATSLMFSIRYESRGMAVLGLVGGYGTPLFFGNIAQGLGGFVLLNYLAILNIGVLILAYFKSWRFFIWTAFIATAVLMTGWLVSPLYDTTKIGIAIFYLTAFWLLFTGATLVFYYFNKREPQNSDMILLVLIGLHFSLSVYGLLADVYGVDQRFFGLIPLMLACAYTGIAYLGATLRPTKQSLTLYPMALAILFITLIFPFEFDGSVLTIAWLIEASVLGGVALLMKRHMLARFATPVYVLGLLMLLFDKASYRVADAMPILNERFGLYMVAVASAFFLMYVFAKLSNTAEASRAQLDQEGGHGQDIQEQSRRPSLERVFFSIANILIAIIIAGELYIFGTFFGLDEHVFHSFFNPRFLLLLVVLMYASSVMFLSAKKTGESGVYEGRVLWAFISANAIVAIALFSELVDFYRYTETVTAIFNARTIIFSIGIAYASIVSVMAYRGVVGIFRSFTNVSTLMFVVVNILLGSWALLEINDYYALLDPELYTALFNVRTFVILLLVSFTATVSRLCYKKVFDYSNWVAGLYFVATNVLLIVLGLIEILDYHNIFVSERLGSIAADMQASLYVTLFFVLYGFGSLAVGIATRYTLLRQIGMTVLSIAVLKVFLIDVWNLEPLYRVIAFVCLGIALLVVGYLYNRHKERIVSIITDNPVVDSDQKHNDQ